MTDDAVSQLLARLPNAESDAVRSERVRARCHAALARDERREEVSSTARSGEWSLFAGLGCLYAAEMIKQALRLYGIV